MKIFYFTDDRSKYGQGNYYLDYMDGFLKVADEMTISDNISEVDGSYDLLVIGHGGQDVLLRSMQIPKVKVTTIILSKNDYKSMKAKKRMARKLNACLVVTNHKSAVKVLKDRFYKTIWLPFCSCERFSNYNKTRSLDVGFRANKNTQWNSGVRDCFFYNLVKATHDRPTDLLLSDNGEGFLFGQDYIDFLNDCKLVGNTASAIGTVGPRFIESMSCGCVPIAPEDYYEGLLKPDVHYVKANSEVEIATKVKKFLYDIEYKESLLYNCKKFVEENSIEKQVDRILRSI